MNKTYADHLIKNRPVEMRWVKARTCHGKLVSGWLVSYEGDTAIIRRQDGRKDFKAPLIEVEYR